MSAITSGSVRPEAVSRDSPPAASRSAPGKRTVTGMISLPKRGAEISISPIGYQHDDTARFFPRDRERRGHRGAAGWPGEDAFLSREALRHGERFLCPHDPVHVGDAFVPDRRTERRRHVFPAFDAMQRVVRLHRDDANTFRTKPPRDADDGPGGTDAGNDVRHPPPALLPDLGRGTELVRQRVRRVRVLIDVDVAVRIRGGSSLRFADRAIRSLEGIGEDELCTKRAGDALPLERYLVRHAELERMTANGADHRERDTGVAARRIEHDASTPEPAFLLRVEHHPERRPIFHTPAGIRALDLHPEVPAKARADPAQWDERGVADALEDRAPHALADEVDGETGHLREASGGRVKPGRSPARVARDEAPRRSRRSLRRRAT